MMEEVRAIKAFFPFHFSNLKNLEQHFHLHIIQLICIHCKFFSLSQIKEAMKQRTLGVIASENKVLFLFHSSLSMAKIN